MKKLLNTVVVGMIGLFTGLALAAQVETIDGIPHVSSPATAAKDLEMLNLKELWRSGGDDDEIFYGSVGSIVGADNGDVYILDTQQSQVQVFQPEGQWIGSLSRDGDGPGEVRSPECIYIDKEGRVCFPQSPTGTIVRVNRDNTPAESISFSTGGGTDEGLTIPLDSCRAGDGVAIAGMRLFFGDDGRSRRHYFLSRCDASGLQQSVLMEKDDYVDYTDFRLDESNMDFGWNRWVFGQDQRYYVAPERNKYRVEVYDANGKLEKVITRAYKAYERDEFLERRATMVIEGVAAYHRAPLQGLTIEDVEPDILGLWVDRDGCLWVRTSRGLAEKPEGAYAVMDVFTPDGTFNRQVALLCEADPYRDSMTLLDDGRVVLTFGALDAWLTQQAVEQTEDEASGARSLEIVVYGRE